MSPSVWRSNFDEIGDCPVVKRAVDEIAEPPCESERNPRNVGGAQTAMSKKQQLRRNAKLRTS